MLLDVRYRIQKSRRAKPKLIHSYRLKPYHGPALNSWISEKKEAATPAESRVASAGEIESVNGVSVLTVSRDCESDGNAATVVLRGLYIWPILRQFSWQKSSKTREGDLPPP